LKTLILRISLALLLLIVGVRHGQGQQKGELYLGLGLDVTREKEYKKGEFDLNVLPFVIQYYLNKTVAVRASTVVNLHPGILITLFFIAPTPALIRIHYSMSN